MSKEAIRLSQGPELPPLDIPEGNQAHLLDYSRIKTPQELGQAIALAMHTLHAAGADKQRVQNRADALRQGLCRIRRDVPSLRSWSVPPRMGDDPMQELNDYYQWAQDVCVATGLSRAPARKKRGPRVVTDPENDRRIFEDWKVSDVRTFADFATSRGLKARDVKLAIDRHEKRLPKSGE